MNCPKCGKELTNGHLYCEACGYEINLVPEFEAEVEESIAESMKEIVDAAALEQEQTKKEPIITKKDTAFLISGGVISIVIFVLTAAFFAGRAIWNNSTFIHEMVVEYYLDDGEYDSAVSYMEQIIKRSPEKASHRFQLCQIYMQIGQDEKALEIYKIIAGSPQFTFDEQLAAVEKIIAYYEEKEEYESIAEYLTTIQDETIRLTYWNYMCVPVTFSQPEGTYASLITLKLESDGIGTIHYTTDGSEPNAKSPEFKGTIFLETGENTISAVFINNYGVTSPVTTKTYFIESKQVLPPEVLANSGTYNYPVEIEVEETPYARTYYTTDGTTPTRGSLLYTGTIHVPTGKSVYKFVSIDSSGMASEVITRNFHVTLDTEMTNKDAEKILVNYLVNGGAASDGKGHIIQDDTHILIYEYLYPLTVEVGKDCYYFAEVSRDTTTLEQHRTGKYYGVDIRTEEIYTLTQ